ncbi:MAG: hypothetical protein FWC23_05385 [Chitinispirillia bacterium]|nr:hypothetical protein [Chitinispirillia bacterium]MCL2268602.1 hypothetical protein [Chitinispirillia bacterium]
MAKKYVSRNTVLRNGTKLEDMKSFKMGEKTHRTEVELMDGTGTVDTVSPYKFSIDYAIPKTGAKLDWSDVVDDTFIIELDGGKRVTYSGVDCLSQGEATMDGAQEAVIPLEFIAARMDID